jgi:hypothetical protein
VDILAEVEFLLEGTLHLPDLPLSEGVLSVLELTNMWTRHFLLGLLQ